MEDEKSTVSNDDLTRVAMKTTVGLRRSMSKHGIRQIADFVNGLAFAGVLLQKNAAGKGTETFAEVFSKNAHALKARIEHEEFSGDLEDLRQHQMGVTDQSPVEMLITAGLSAESTIMKIAEEYGFGRRDMLEMASIAIVAAIIATRGVDARELDEIIESIREKAKIWDAMNPSDAEMFPDDDTL